MLGRWFEPPIYPVENKTKSDLIIRKIFVPLLPVDSLSYIGGFRKRKSGPKHDGVLLGCIVLNLLGGLRVTHVIYS